MFARGICRNRWDCKKSNSRRDEYHLSVNTRGHPIPYYALRKIQSREDIGFEILSHQLNGDFRHGSPLADASVVHQNVELKFEYVCHIVRVEQVELLDFECFEAERVSLFPKCGHLRPGLNCC